MLFENVVRSEIKALSPYVPGRSIDEIREEYGLERVVKLASNENPLGVPPLVQAALARHAGEAFRYPASGNPRLVKAVSRFYGVDPACVALGNGSDEILDSLIRILAVPGRDNVVCFEPCFSLYPVQGQINAVEVRRVPLNEDRTFDFGKLLAKVDANTRIVFITTPDNPSGYCPRPEAVEAFAKALPEDCLLVIDEAYMDFAPAKGETEADWSLFAAGRLPKNAAVVRTFSKSFGLAGIRLGMGFLPKNLAGYYWRMRLPFSVNILAEEAGMAALEDEAFREATLECVRSGRDYLEAELKRLGCTVLPSRANFLMYCLPADKFSKARDSYQWMLSKGMIVRSLAGSYESPDWIRVTVGTEEENKLFIDLLAQYLSL